MAKLMIVESPNKVKKIKGILGPGWDVGFSLGHVRDLPKKTLGVGPDYTLDYEFNDRGKGIIDGLKPRVARAEAVYLATDPDREGEAIAWHLAQTLKLKTYYRVTFDAITETVVRRAVTAPRQIDMDLVRSQEARRCADRLVGYKVSPTLSQQTGIAGLSAGRVQSVAVRLVVDRQREIDAFKETNHFGVEAEFNGWKAQWNTAPHLPEGKKYILDSELAARVAQCRDFRVTHSETKSTTQAPPAAFTTATLLQAGSVALDLKPEETAAVAQKLFEAGLITYHRTDSQNLSSEAIEEIRRYATSKGLQLPRQGRRWKSKDTAQEAHEAIRPTHIDHRQGGEDETQKTLYDLIWRRAVASQLADAEYSVTQLRLDADLDLDRYEFTATGRILTNSGWRVLTQEDATDEGQQDADTPREGGAVPALALGTAIRSSSTRVVNKTTKAPKGYTQASLIKKLESEGIGRPSTYPQILSNIITKRAYLVEIKKMLVPSDLAKLLVDSLIRSFHFMNYGYTRELEQQLDDIAHRKARYLDVISALDQQLQTELGQLRIQSIVPLASPRPSGGATSASAPEGAIPCPKCKVGHLRRPSGRDFYGCDHYRAGCTYSVNITIAKKKLSDKQIEKLCNNGRTALIHGFINKQGKPFNAILRCSEATAWRTAFEFEN